MSASAPTEERSPAEMLGDILEQYDRFHPGGNRALILRAFAVAEAGHADQLRATGDPFIVHPLATTEILAGYGMDAATLAASLLHDIVEDTDATLEEITAEFGEEVAGLIDGVTKLDRIKFSSREEQQAATIRKMAIAMSRDIRVLLIKLADRTHNLRTIYPLSPEKQRRVASETLDVYAPLAHRLGVQEIKHELEERSFGVLYPKRKTELEAQVRRRAPERETYLEKVIEEVAGTLRDAGVAAEVGGRPKHLYSIYRKLVSTGLEFDEIHDLIGIRIIVPEVRDCYAALGLVHTMWPPVHGRFKDYIAMPKFNLYQSLHTTVVGPEGKPLEVQIRTVEMHDRAEHGIAAHWRYKEGGSGDDELPFVADLRFLQEESTDPAEFLANLKLDLYQDEVFALTPRGDVITLPAKATPVDFAYRIHTDVGHRCVGAKVNGRLVSLATELESGDIVEIQTSKSQDAHPSRDWLGFVKSSRAAGKIRQWFSKQRRETALSEGREAINKAMRREGLPTSGREATLVEVAEDLGFDGLESLYVSVGDGRMSASTVTGRLARRFAPEASDEVEVEVLKSLFAPPPTRPRPSSGIIVEGLDDVLVRLAQCCNPVPGDDIIGFVTVGRGVSVHRSDCTNMGALEDHAERLIEVGWAADRIESFFVWIQVEALDRPKLLRDVTSVLSELGANIHTSSSVVGRDRIAFLRYEVELSDPRLLDRAIGDLRAVSGVFDAYRLTPGG
jgi:GTP pyrophosphokinase